MKPTLKRFAIAACAVLFLSLISTFALEDASVPATHGVANANMDRSVVPGDDFYAYANGGWLKRTEIPPDRSIVGVFTRLGDMANKRTADLIEEAAKSKASAGSGPRQIADLYNSFMNEPAIESKGLS